MFGKLAPKDIEAVLHSQLVGRIGCHADGQTYVVPVSYAYDGTNIYCHSFEGKKLDMMRKNPNVCFEIENTKNLANWQSVIAWGEFEEITDSKERRDAVQILESRALPMLSSETMHLASHWPFPEPDESKIKGVVFRIRLAEKTGRFEKVQDEFFFAT